MLENITTTAKYQGTLTTEDARYEVTYEMKDTTLLSINAIIYVDGIMIGTMGMNQRGLKMCSIKGDTIPHMTVLDELITGITTIQDGGTNEME